MPQQKINIMERGAKLLPFPIRQGTFTVMVVLHSRGQDIVVEVLMVSVAFRAKNACEDGVPNSVPITLNCTTKRTEHFS